MNYIILYSFNILEEYLKLFSLKLNDEIRLFFIIIKLLD